MSALDLVELGARWMHVAAAALWVGLGWTLAWILPARAARSAAAAGAWMRGAMIATLATGVALLFLVYYGPRTAYLTGAAPEAGAWMRALLALAAGAAAAEGLQRLPARLGAAAGLGFAAVAIAVASALSERIGLTDRATYVHVGALLALVMAVNADRAIAPALAAGAAPPARRLAWNAALAFPVLLLMVGAGQTGLFGFGVPATVATALAIGWAAAATLARVAGRPPDDV